MEPAVACELWNSTPTENVKLFIYVGDDDITTGPLWIPAFMLKGLPCLNKVFPFRFVA